MRIRSMASRAAALVFPDRCIFCGQVMEYCENRICICSHCAQKLIFSDEMCTCRLCGRRLPAGETLCQTCQSHRHHFNKAVSCLTYELAVRKSILQYKFSNRPDHARTFAAMMVRRLRPLCTQYHFDLVVCAPLSKSARQKRGYNQAALIARQVAKALRLPFMENVFCKTKETPKQSTLHYSERMENVSHAFALTVPKETLRDKTILLIDDVLTTGATADALAKLLKKAGAAIVVVAVVAGTEPDRTDKKTTAVNWEELAF